MQDSAPQGQGQVFPCGLAVLGELLLSSPLVHKGLFPGEKQALQPSVFCLAVNITVLHKPMAKTWVTAQSSGQKGVGKEFIPERKVSLRLPFFPCLVSKEQGLLSFPVA